MKLASLKSGGCEGRLVVAGRELSHFQAVPDIASSLSEALARWTQCASRLQEVYACLENGHARHAQPLRRAFCSPPFPGVLKVVAVPYFRSFSVSTHGPHAELIAATEAGLDLTLCIALALTPRVGSMTGPVSVASAPLAMLWAVAECPEGVGTSQPSVAVCAPAAVVLEELQSQFGPFTLRTGRNGGSQRVCSVKPPSWLAIADRLPENANILLLPWAEGENAVAHPGRAHKVRVPMDECWRCDISSGDGSSVFGALEVCVLRAPSGYAGARECGFPQPR